MQLDRDILTHFMDYLSKQRASLARRLKVLHHQRLDHYSDAMTVTSQSVVDTYDGEGFDSEEEVLELSEIVDSALVRVYLELGHPLLQSLFRVRNYCNVETIEALLLSRKKYLDLIEFYRGKRLHSKALDLIKR